MRINTIYTACFGSLYLQPIHAPGLNCVCYTDQHTSSRINGWRMIHHRARFCDARMSAKWYKCMSHYFFPDEATVWIDASIRIKDMQAFMAHVEETPATQIGLLRHPDRQSLIAEADFSMQLPKYKNEPCVPQVQAYLQEVPDNVFQFCGGLLVRGHTPTIEKFNVAWLNEIIRWSVQDQLALNYLLAKYEIPTHTLPWNLYDNLAFDWSGPHPL